MFRKKSGFTLLELIVVMAVIAILVAMGVPRFIGYTKDANVTAMKADAKVLEDACMIYHLENEGWPCEIEGEEFVEATDLASGLVTALAGTKAYEINGDLLGEHIRSLKNNISEYALIIDGDYEGKVVHKAGVEDRSGTTHYGIDIEG